MNTTTMLNNAIGMMQLDIMNPAEMPIDQAIRAVTAIAALSQAEAALAQAEAAQRIATALEWQQQQQIEELKIQAGYYDTGEINEEP